MKREKKVLSSFYEALEKSLEEPLDSGAYSHLSAHFKAALKKKRANRLIKSGAGLGYGWPCFPNKIFTRVKRPNRAVGASDFKAAFRLSTNSNLFNSMYIMYIKYIFIHLIWATFECF